MNGNPISGEWNAEFPHWDPEVAEAFIKSEIDGGLKVENVPIGKRVIIETAHHTYTLEHRGDGYYISGHPELCPNPERVTIKGAILGTSLLKKGFVGRDLGFEGYLLDKKLPFTTSKVVEISIRE